MPVGIEDLQSLYIPWQKQRLAEERRKRNLVSTAWPSGRQSETSWGKKDIFVVMTGGVVRKQEKPVCGDPQEPGPLVMCWVHWDSGCEVVSTM